MSLLGVHTACTVTFDRVGRTFDTANGPHDVLADINLELHPAEILAIVGASGCGKSTLLRLAGGLDTTTRGAVHIDGTPVAGIDPRCAIAFQEPRLLPWRTVATNVGLGLPRQGGTRASGPKTPAGPKSPVGQKTPKTPTPQPQPFTKAEAAERVAELLHLVGLDDFASHKPRQISGGMAQRVALARALARNPGVLLLDEPFGALDALTRIKMQDLLLEIHAAEPTTILLVTHDVDEALQLADRVVVLGREHRNSPATITRIVDVPGARPRERSAPHLAELRDDLLELLGVPRHTPTR